MRLTPILATIMVLLVGVPPAVASEADVKADAPALQLTRFVVSGILQKSGKTREVVIKPVHAVELARSSPEALVQFVRDVNRLYPGYVLIPELRSCLEAPAVEPGLGSEPEVARGETEEIDKVGMRDL